MIKEGISENGKVEKRYYLVRRKFAVTTKDVEAVFPDIQNTGSVNIRLTVKGAEKMTKFTKGLKSCDMIVVILDGKVVSARLNAPSLGRIFQISGQKSVEEFNLLAESFLSSFSHQLKKTVVLGK